MAKLDGLSNKDLEALMKQRGNKILQIINHVRSLNPMNMHWPQNYLGTGIYEDLEEGGRKIKNYHRFDVSAKYLYDEEHRERSILEYNGKVVLDVIHPIGWTDDMKDVTVVVYKEGKWEQAFNKIIEMGWTNAIRAYLEPIHEAMERKAEKERRQRAKELGMATKRMEREDLEARAHNLGF
jgi:hypothetical protein